MGTRAAGEQGGGAARESGGGSQGGGGLGTGGGDGCAPSSRGEETLLSPSPLPKSMATSAAPVRDGADRRTDGPTKASEQIRARTSMSAGEEMYEASLFSVPFVVPFGEGNPEHV